MRSSQPGRRTTAALLLVALVVAGCKESPQGGRGVDLGSALDASRDAAAAGDALRDASGSADAGGDGAGSVDARRDGKPSADARRDAGAARDGRPAPDRGTADRGMADGLSPVTGKTYYVAPGGTDTNPGTQALPFKTLQKGGSALAAGDRLVVRGGLYAETVTFSRSGSAAQPIQIVAFSGETPVVEGAKGRPTTWGCLVTVSGAYVQLSGLEVRNSDWMGLCLEGSHGLARAMNVHDNQEQGIFVSGSNSLVESCHVWQNAARNRPGSTPYAGGGWACALCAARNLVSGVTLRGNRSHDNWGEGISTFESTGTVIEDNIVYNNHSNIYVSDAVNALVQRNLVYHTGSPVVTNGSHAGIMMGDEKNTATYPGSQGITIVNNLVLGCARNVFWWQGFQHGMKNVLIAHNTLVNSSSEAGIVLNSGPHQNVRVENNLVLQEGGLPVGAFDTFTGLSFSSNLWSKAPPSGAARAGDVVGDPKLARTGPTTAGQLLPDYFKVQSSSPGINKGKVLSEVQEDFFRKARGTSPDLGAHEL
ncbi:MAG: right-handed parallel beta-helix repeat-containing protein [Deltaproteobacteria bacterium]|nr:right-handed parallel beta-helix repeat-containing protein [Deltaproteobacteria bacterium]